MAINLRSARRACWTTAFAALLCGTAVIAWHVAVPVETAASVSRSAEANPSPRGTERDFVKLQSALDRLAARSLRAPLSPPPTPQLVVAPQYGLAGTLVDGERSIAFIQFPDGGVRPLQLHEQRGEVRVLAIAPRRATLQVDRARIELQMPGAAP